MIFIDDDIKFIVKERGYLDARSNRIGRIEYGLVEIIGYALYTMHTHNHDCMACDLETFIKLITDHWAGTGGVYPKDMIVRDDR
jgi:hypothetical protein